MLNSVLSMGAEQSALLVCTQTGKPEPPLRLHNSEKYFQLYFDQMPEPRTGPVTEALLHLIRNKPQNFGGNSWPNIVDQDSGYENDGLDMDEPETPSEDEPLQNIDIVTDTVELSTSDITMDTSSNEAKQLYEDFEMLPLEFMEMQSIEETEAMLEFEREFAKRVAELGDGEI